MGNKLGFDFESGDGKMSVAVTDQQQALEHEHAGRPDLRPAAEKRQDELADQRLNLKEEEGADKDSQAIDEGVFLRAAGHYGESCIQDFLAIITPAINLPFNWSFVKLLFNTFLR